jgi:mannose-6-phosphate isomerase-like protein (cupin superfamily)
VRAPEVIDLNAKLSLFADHWKPRIVSHYNGNEVRIVKVQGDFTWHSHTDTDELFFVLSGELGVEFRDGVRTLKPGELLVVPKGLEHRPFAAKECHVMVMDRDGEPNTGVNPSESTCARLEEI